MSPHLGILCCHNFAAEVGAGVTAEGWSDVTVAAFPARCGRPPLSWDEVRALLPVECTQIIVVGRACLAALGEAPAGMVPVKTLPLRQCFHLVASTTLVDEAMADGAYLLTPSWLADWRGQLAALGFVPEQAGEFFSEFARELLLLDTGLDAATLQHLGEFAAVAGVPARRVAVGLDGVRARLVQWVLEWRLAEQARQTRESARQHARELAEHVAAMDMLKALARTRHEDEAIARIGELFQMLFAPGELGYLRVENGIALPLPGAAEIAPALAAQLHGLLETGGGGAAEHVWTADGQGFCLRISDGEAVLGLVAVSGLAFPQYRERYLNLALAISGVCGLAIDNARNRRRLLEAEKLASLGIVVAGVAHEINTPLGVSQTAASVLQEQVQRLGEAFAARRMTQTDLQTYLQQAGSALTLIRGNLERIGHLTDAFRQVAVQGQPLRREAFTLRDCIEQVVRSLGDRLDPARVHLTIDCDPALMIVSSADDWASILINFISNSLKHGFRGRAQGEIAIAVERTPRFLHLEYRDNGAGMAAATLARLFEPFFTTDMQQGMGLGMHLVYNLVTHRLGGTLRCDSTPAQGVRFIIDIPVEMLA